MEIYACVDSNFLIHHSAYTKLLLEVFKDSNLLLEYFKLKFQRNRNNLNKDVEIINISIKSLNFFIVLSKIAENLLKGIESSILLEDRLCNYLFGYYILWSVLV